MDRKVSVILGDICFNGCHDQKIMEIRGNIDRKINHFFPNIEKIYFLNQNLRTKTVQKVLECVDVEKIKELCFSFHQAKSVFSLIQKILLNQQSQCFNSIKFQFRSIKNGYTDQYDCESMFNFMDFAINFSKRIQHIDIEIMECFNGDNKYQFSNFIDKFENLKTINISVSQRLKSYGTRSKEYKYENTTTQIFQSITNKSGLESIRFHAYNTEKIPVHNLLKILKNNEKSIHTLIINCPLISSKNLESYFDSDIVDLLVKFEKLPRLKHIGGSSTFEKAFSKWKYQFSYNSLRRLKESVDKKQSHEIIKKILRETNINLFNCFQLQCMFNILKDIDAQHLMIDALDNFLFVDPQEIQTENQLFEYMFVYNCDEQLAIKFAHQIGKENMEQHMSIFLNQIQLHFERHHMSPYFSIENQTTMLRTIFQIMDNQDSKHCGGSMYQQYVSFYLPNQYKQIMKNKDELYIESSKPKNEHPSAKKLKTIHVKQPSKSIDYIPDDCVREIFSFVEEMQRVQSFQEWKCLQLVCKSWRDVCSNILESNK